MKRKTLAVLLTLSVTLLCAACGAGTGNDSVASTTESMNSSSQDGWAETPMAAMPKEETIVEDAAEEESAPAAGDTAGRPLKMVYTASLEMETTDFSSAVSALSALTESCGGYYENSTTGTRGGGYQWAEYTVRVPAEDFQSFFTQAGEICHTTWSNTTQDNISEAYYDTDGRLETQKIKLQRLQELLSRAEAMEDIITIESAISETEWMIDDLSGTLRHYDNMVDYATVTITLNEVYKLSYTEEPPQGFASRLGGALAGGWVNFTDGMENLAVGLAYNWMWVLLAAAAAVIVVRRLVRRRRRRMALAAEESRKEEK